MPIAVSGKAGIGERTAGPMLLRHDGSRLDRRTAHRWVRSIAKRAAIGQVHPWGSAPIGISVTDFVDEQVPYVGVARIRRR